MVKANTIRQNRVIALSLAFVLVAIGLAWWGVANSSFANGASCGPARAFQFDTDLLVIKKPTILHIRFRDHSSFYKPVGVSRTVKVLFRKGEYTVRNSFGSGWEYDRACLRPKSFLRNEIKNGNLPKISVLRFRQSNQVLKH